MVFCTGCDGCGCLELGLKLCELWKLLFDSESNSNFHLIVDDGGQTNDRNDSNPYKV